MSLTPEPAGTQTVPEAVPVPPKRPRRWLLFFLAIFAFAVGGFLVVFPWVDAWDLNSLPEFIPRVSDIWDEPSFRGALTGLGFVNLYIGVLQFVRFLRRGR